MKKMFITIRIWEETKAKLEAIRIDLIKKKQTMISLAQTIEYLIEHYNNNKKD